MKFSHARLSRDDHWCLLVCLKFMILALRRHTHMYRVHTPQKMGGILSMPTSEEKGLAMSLFRKCIPFRLCVSTYGPRIVAVLFRGSSA